MVRTAFIIGVLLLSSVSNESAAAVADPSTGNGVLELCEAPRGSFESGLCLGFIEGVVEKDKLSRWMDSTNTYLCDLPGVTNGQIYDVVVAFLRAHPEQRHHHGASLVSRAIQQAFCQK